jgi:hypothetical protein
MEGSMNAGEPVVLNQIGETKGDWARRQFRDDLLDSLGVALLGAEVAVIGGEMDGVSVVTHKAWRDALFASRVDPLPPVSNHAAEVLTHASVTVWAVCPRCKIAGPILVTIEPELRVDDSGGELRVKAKAKARTHVCGQLTIPVGPPVEGQESLELEDIVGDRCDAIVRYDPEADEDVFCRLPAGHEGDHDELGPVAIAAAPCPWPGCELEAEHQGAHITAVDDAPGDGAS